MLLAASKRQHYVKPMSFERNKPLRIDSGHVNIYIIRYLYASIGMDPVGGRATHQPLLVAIRDMKVHSEAIHLAD
jgi:hypothetical protein